MFAFAVLCAFIILFYHSCKTRGLTNAIKIFGLGIAGFVIKEIENRINEPVRYVPGEDAFYLFGVPIVVVMGWIFALYIGWQMAEGILDRFSPKASGKLFPTIAVASVIVGAIALIMEVHGTNPNIDWWQWKASGMLAFEPKFWGINLLMVMEWPRVCFTGLSMVLLFEFSPLRKVRWRHLHFVIVMLLTSVFYLPVMLFESMGQPVEDNLILLTGIFGLFTILAYAMMKNHKVWTDVYLFFIWIQIYNFFINPFGWVAVIWIVATIIIFFFYRKTSMDYGEHYSN